MDIVGVIPARYASKRLPGKVLLDIGGKTMVQRVYEQSLKASSLSKVVVATDDKRVFDHVHSFGGEVVMTSIHHQSGTDRCYEAIEVLNSNCDIVLNIQGDEPFIHPEEIEELCQLIISYQSDIGTLAKVFTDKKKLLDPNFGKVVINRQGYAMYFSRSIIPYNRELDKIEDISPLNYLKHIGIYAFQRKILKELVQMDQSHLEVNEKLEQLRWLENGYQIKVGLTNYDSNGVDTREDLENARNMLL